VIGIFAGGSSGAAGFGDNIDSMAVTPQISAPDSKARFVIEFFYHSSTRGTRHCQEEDMR
jgi:hypothetical protein